MYHPQIPKQLRGVSHDIVSMHCVNSLLSADDCYAKLEVRLKAVNDWYNLSDKVKAKFTLLDTRTKLPTDVLKEGNWIRIDVPGIGNPSGEGYDWTIITSIESGKDKELYPYFSMTIAPCPAPDGKNGTVAHFYTDEATNTFIIRKVGTCIFAEVHGRNQIENTSKVPTMDAMRNKAIVIGSKMGLGSLNWLAFTSALLEPFKQYD